VQKIKNLANINLEIINGQKEASIIYSSHIEQTLDRSKCYLYIDVGGGSTELSIFADAQLLDSKSFNLGTIRILDNQDEDKTWTDMMQWLQENLRWKY
jgi:exopolyphosphatase/guanosine-5'-triphosphate,3'-diphosphate pyrophosphatase